MRKIYSSGKILALLFCMSVAAYQSAYAQCNVVAQGSVNNATCTYQSETDLYGNLGSGAGAYWQLNVTNGVWYSFYWTSQGCPDNTSFCVNGVSGNTNLNSAAPYTVQSTSTTTWDIGFYEANTTWCGSSAVLYYKLATPTATAGTTSSASVCASGTSYTIPAGYTATNGTISWSTNGTGDGTFSNGTTTTPTYTFGNGDRVNGATVVMTMTVTNATCTATTTFTLTINTLPTTAMINGSTITQNQNAPCGSLSATLTGNTPAAPLGGTGTWSWVGGSGTGTPSFNTVHTPGAIATVTRSGIYEYAWTISTGSGCPASNAYVFVDYIVNPGGGSIAHTSYCSSAQFGTVSVTGATNATAYEWSLPSGLSGSSTTSTIRVGSSIPGIYTVTVTPIDSGLGGFSCPATPVTGTVSVLAGPVIDSIHTGTLSCFGVSNDTITIFGTTSNGNLHYSINGGTTFPNTTGIFPGEAPGTYDIFVKDDSSCTMDYVVNPLVITQPASPLLLSSAVTQISCHGDNNGAIALLPSGGWGSYTYDWSSGQTIQLITGLPAAIYTGTVTDIKGCTASVRDTIVDPAALSDIVTASRVTCAGASNGSATVVSVSGGTPPYSYLWSDFASSATTSGLHGGTYYVIITDSNGCQKRDSAIVTENLPIVLSDSVGQTSCAGFNNSSVHIFASGGSGPYSYVWSPAGSTTADTTNVATGTYSVTVSDANFCSATISVAVSNIPAVTVSNQVTDPTCNGYNNGAIHLIVGGGVAPYTYNWQGGVSNGTNLAFAVAQTYYVTVTDAHNCSTPDSIVVSQPSQLFASGVQKNISCYGYNDGYLLLTTYGGTPPYSYQWYLGTNSSAPVGPITENITQLSPGPYYLVITDANGCQSPFSRTILQPDSLEISMAATNATCQSANSGSVAVIVTGGTTPYQYLWNNFVTDSSQTNIPGGSYGVVVTDSNGCHQTDTIIVSGQPDPMAVNISVNNPTCSDATNGFIGLDVQGGAPPYSYNWSTSPAQSGSIATGLTAGTYTATVSDRAGCQVVESAAIVSPPAINVSIASAATSCISSATAYAVIDVAGGVSPYTYQLGSVIQQSDTFTHLSPGLYTIIVTDANGCLGSTSLTINPTNNLSVTLTATPNVILADEPVQLNAVASDSVIAYMWIPADSLNFSSCGGDTSDCSHPIATPSVDQLYKVTVTDTNGCTASDTIRVIISNQAFVFIPQAFTPNGDGLNDVFEFDILGATTVNVQIWNRWGNLVYSNPDQPNGTGGTYGWNGTYNGSPAPMDTYTYQLVVTYYDGHQQTISGTVVLLR